MITFTRTPLQVKVAQWDGATATLADIVDSCVGFRVTMTADHRLISIETGKTIVRANIGDWLVLEGNTANVYTDEVFKQLYTPPVAAKPKAPKKK